MSMYIQKTNHEERMIILEYLGYTFERIRSAEEVLGDVWEDTFAQIGATIKDPETMARISRRIFMVYDILRDALTAYALMVEPDAYHIGWYFDEANAAKANVEAAQEEAAKRRKK